MGPAPAAGGWELPCVCFAGETLDGWIRTGYLVGRGPPYVL
jgi:hypothetical protein